MSMLKGHNSSDFSEILNITTRQSARGGKNNMSEMTSTVSTPEGDGCLSIVDSILTKDEKKEVMGMLIMADELPDSTLLSGFFTSSQMGGHTPKRPPSLSLSPLHRDLWTVDCKAHSNTNDAPFPAHNHYDTKLSIPDKNLLNINMDLTQQNPEEPIQESNSCVNEGATSGDIDLDKAGDGEAGEGGPTDPDPLNAERIEVGVIRAGDHDDQPSDNDRHSNHLSDGEDGRSEAGAGAEEGDDAWRGGDGKDVKSTKYKDLLQVAEKLGKIDELLETMDSKSSATNRVLQELVHSLEFSQNEIDVLKKENAELKQRLGIQEIEDQRTQYQIKTVDDKVDKIESMVKKRNLVFEGIPEVEGKKEDVEKTISALFDQLAITEEVNFEACYRIGPYSKSKPRPVLVSFERQSQRDMVYYKRMDLKRTQDFQFVWVNEDLGPASKRKKNVIRLITKQAQEQGIDCRTGKYAVHINKVKYDDSNLEDLPPALHPANMKQVQIGENTIAYQSELAPFSNFFPCVIKFGKHRFMCAEQVLQFMKAKTLAKPLAATKIYLSRDPRDMKQKGAELGTSDDWEGRQLDVMYECIKAKFEQNPDLKALLLETGDKELVEATPDRLWGCGATLSSNALRKRDWPGQNKHGKILMVVREELRRAMEA